jgi:succinate dehydrogenase/fumarate reductase flavoprotein subunit
MRQPTVETITTDILILGSGGAGLLAALHAHDANPRASIFITVKGLLGKSGYTRMVQGGYNAVWNPTDSLDNHFRDTIGGGAYLNDQELAWTLVKTAPDRIRELENRIGCFFDRNSDGSIHQKAFAGQSFDRIVHRGDLTGIEIMTWLGEDVYVLRDELKTLMWEKAGLVRQAADLEATQKALAVLRERTQHARVSGTPRLNAEWQEWLSLDSLLTVSEMLVASALQRQESRGAHYRSDYPEIDNRRSMSCQPLVVGIGSTKDFCVRLAKESACLRLVGDRNPDPEVAKLEEELLELGN